jgi:hypothetical protein
MLKKSLTAEKFDIKLRRSEKANSGESRKTLAYPSSAATIIRQEARVDGLAQLQAHSFSRNNSHGT